MKRFPKFILLVLMCCGLNAFCQSVFIQQNGRVRACKGKLTDSDKGKTKGDYDHNENYTLTLSVPGAKKITLVFSTFCTEKDNDILRIFDGKDTFATLLGTYSGTKGPGTISSTDSFITLHFISDKSVACTGWEAAFTTTIIPPAAPSLSLSTSPKCNDNQLFFTTAKPVPCDSIKASNIKINGPPGISAISVTALNCSSGSATKFQVGLNGKMQLNGSYSLNLTTYFKDFCDSVYKLSSNLNFSVSDCPLKVILTVDNDTICKGSCTYLRAAVSGGNASKYQYTWTPSGITGAGPQKICPTADTRYILYVTDGSSIPSADTVDVVVVNPPQAQQDTEICYYGNNIYLKATPAGGKWYGKGVVNASTGEFKPNGNYGLNKVWYQLGTCADTVQVNSTVPWNLENQFCPGTPASPLWWYGPAGGTWSGPNVTSTGIFNPSSSGTFKDTYTWKGCISVKTVLVQAIKVKKYDTACESTISDTLEFSPYGIYPNWFPGLVNSYYQWVNPSQMGGPGTKTIIWNGGGCKDTTYYTILGSYAGKNDTFCPFAGAKALAGFRPPAGGIWSGKGISNPSNPIYDPAFFSGLGKPSYVDTVSISSGRCVAKKLVYLYPTKINKKDTLFFCLESTPKSITNALVGLVPTGGTWTGMGISASGLFNPAIAGYGAHMLYYLKNGCLDSVLAFVRPKPIVQSDTTVCISALAFNCRASQSGGKFAGPGITNQVLGTFNPSVAGKGTKTITYTSRDGCIATFRIIVDSMPVTYFTTSQTDYCFKDSGFLLQASPSGGVFSGPGVSGTHFNPAQAGSGVHKLFYTISSGTCVATANFSVLVGDTLQVTVSPAKDTICPGEILLVKATGKGGDKFSWNYQWSHGQSGANTFVTPKTSQNYIVSLTDGCSDMAQAMVQITRHNQPYFNALISLPRCFGQNGFVKLRMKDNDPYQFTWDVVPAFAGDSFNAPAGNTYRVTAVNQRTGCSSDTQILIPGYKAIQAGFVLNITGGEHCITNIYPKLQVFNGSQGGETGTWYWGDGSSDPYDPNSNPSHIYAGDKTQYHIKLVIGNKGGCLDSAETDLCFRDTIVVFVPNTFTPDGDGVNDVFLPSVNGAQRYELYIYNRWGQQVYATTVAGNGWDGTYNGRECPEGVYAWKLIYKGRKTFAVLKEGTVTVLKRK